MRKTILVVLMTFAIIVTVAPVTSDSSGATIFSYDGQWITGWLHWGIATYDGPALGAAYVKPGPYPYEFNLSEPLHVHLQIRHQLGRPQESEENYLTIYIDGAPVFEADTIGLDWYPYGDGIDLIDLGTVPAGTHSINMSATSGGHYAMDWFKVLKLEETHDVAVTNVSAPAEATQGDDITINVNVTNLGGYEETFNVTIRYDSEVIGTKPVTLILASSATIPFSWETAGVALGLHTITAEAILAGDANLTNNNATTPIEIKLPLHDVAITNITATSFKVDVGEPVTISVDIANEGDFNETVDVTVSYDSEVIGTKTVTLDVGESKPVQFTWYTTDVPLGRYTISVEASVAVDDDPADNTVTTEWGIDIVPEFPTLIPLLLVLAILAVSTIILRKKLRLINHRNTTSLS